MYEWLPRAGVCGMVFFFVFFIFGVMKCSKVDCGDGFTTCEYTESHSVVCFKWSNCMTCQLSLNTDVIIINLVISLLCLKLSNSCPSHSE